MGMKYRNAEGQIIDTSEKWSNKGFIVECYSEYIRMCGLGKTSAVSGKLISNMNFDAYLIECDKNLNILLGDLVQQALMNKVSKQEKEFNEAMIRKSKEGIKWYFGLDSEEARMSVYSEEAPTEEHLKKIVEKQAEEDVIVNAPKSLDKPEVFQGRTVKTTSVLKIMKKADVKPGLITRDGMKDEIKRDVK